MEVTCYTWVVCCLKIFLDKPWLYLFSYFSRCTCPGCKAPRAEYENSLAPMSLLVGFSLKHKNKLLWATYGHREDCTQKCLRGFFPDSLWNIDTKIEDSAPLRVTALNSVPHGSRGRFTKKPSFFSETSFHHLCKHLHQWRSVCFIVRSFPVSPHKREHWGWDPFPGTKPHIAFPSSAGPGVLSRRLTRESKTHSCTDPSAWSILACEKWCCGVKRKSFPDIVPLWFQFFHPYDNIIFSNDEKE